MHNIKLIQFVREAQEKSPETSINTKVVQRHSAFTVLNLQLFCCILIDLMYMYCVEEIEGLVAYDISCHSCSKEIAGPSMNYI